MTDATQDDIAYLQGYKAGKKFHDEPVLNRIANIERRYEQYDKSVYYAGFVDGWYDAEQE